MSRTFYALVAVSILVVLSFLAGDLHRSRKDQTKFAHVVAKADKALTEALEMKRDAEREFRAGLRAATRQEPTPPPVTDRTL